MVLQGNRSFVLTTFGAQGHAMNGERSAIPYQFWFVPRCVPAVLARTTSQEGGHAALSDNGALIVYETFFDDSRRKT